MGSMGEGPAVQRKLTGWKSIGRYLGRSERAVQLWELERRLPVHRIPGGRGKTVYAYTDELDAWMAEGDRCNAPVVESLPTLVSQTLAPPILGTDTRPDDRCVARPPGILVMPFENYDGSVTSSFGDAICQKLIARLAEVQNMVRVLSWQTAKSARDGAEPLESLASRLSVRYLVEGSVDCSGRAKRVDVRIVDADIDQIVVASRLVTRLDDHAAFQEKVAEAVAMHFALVLEGALVEPICPIETTPTGFLDYLLGVWRFSKGPSTGIGEAVGSFDRALTRDPGFTPAQAMRGIALLQEASGLQLDEVFSTQVRSIATRCNASNTARLTTAFLDAAIAIQCDRDWPGAEHRLSKVLRSFSSALASSGRLYDRRSPRRPRRDHPPGLSSPLVDCATGRSVTGGVLEDLMGLLARVHERRSVGR